jgi:malonate-semialdehyde dehydrogenase (acetylating)/methylmalonate-semialdehyde dehydrogenase
MTIREIPLFIDGQAVRSASADWHEVRNPATQQVVARVPFATQAEVDRAVASAKKAFAGWHRVPLVQRMRIMLRFQGLIRQNTARRRPRAAGITGSGAPTASRRSSSGPRPRQ